MLAQKKQYSYIIHNQTIQDDYAWMRDTKWPNVEHKEILSYLKAENLNAESYFSNLSNLKQEIVEELKGRIQLSDQSTPVRKDDYWYYNRIEEESQYKLYCRVKSSIRNAAKFIAQSDNLEEIILDIPFLAQNKSFYNLGGFSISPNGNYLAYSYDDTGNERYKINVKNLETSELLDIEICDASSQIIWHKSIFGFFYTKIDENWRSLQLFFYNINNDTHSLIYEEKDHLYNLSISQTNIGKFLLLNISGHSANEIRVLDLEILEEGLIENLILVSEREEKRFYDIEHHGGYFYIRHNSSTKTKEFFLSRALISKPDDWQQILREFNLDYLVSFDVTQSSLLLNIKKDGLPYLMIFDIANLQKIEELYFISGEARIYSTNFEDDDIRLDISSLIQPSSIYLRDGVGNKILLKQQLIPSGFDSELYHVERVKIALVPCTIVYRKDKFKKDGNNPLYLYGYGSYGISIPTSFRSSIISLLDRGVVYAIAHIRGGDDLGFEWYESAKFLNKKRSFEDYIAICDYLTKEGYCKKIIASGGSAGGMLVGAVLNMRPELFQAAILHVPFVDVLNTMLDENLPLTPGEFKEWGNPKDPEYFEYIKSYSPYDNITSQEYPPMFVTAGLSDPRVGYWEAAKWVAKLREMKLGDHPIIFKTNMKQGHKGASGRFSYLEEIAEEFAFVVDQAESCYNNSI